MVKNQYDQHIHTSLSYDSEPNNMASDVAKAAIEKGLAGIAITDHLDPLWPDDNDPSTLDLAAYEKALTETEHTYGIKSALQKESNLA